MHFRIVVLSSDKYAEDEKYEIREKLQKKVGADYVDFMESYTPVRFRYCFKEKDYVWYTFEYEKGTLKCLGMGLILPKKWEEKYEKILVYDAHI